MEEIKTFSSEEFGEIRTTNINGEPWFVGKDVCEAFGDTNHKRSLASIDDSDRCISKIDTAGGKQNMVIINESGLYSLLFQMQPQKAKGVSQNEPLIEERIKKLKRFKRWVTSEVLPSIRRTGQYQMPNLSKEMQAIVLLDTRTIAMEKRMDKLEFDIPLYGSEADELSNHVKRKGVAILGGKNTEAYKDTNIRSKVYRDIYDQIKREFGIYSGDGKPRSYKALKRKYVDEAHELVECYEAPLYLQEIIKEANAQLTLIS